MSVTDTSGLAQLISSLDIRGTQRSQNGAKALDTRSAQELAKKLHQILGDENSGPLVKHNEKGQILNEEGLPVIDITENAGMSDGLRPSSIVPQATIHIPLSALTEAQKDERRRDVDRILDELEKEEEEEERKRATQTEREAVETLKEEKERAADNMAKALAATNKLMYQQRSMPSKSAQTTRSSISSKAPYSHASETVTKSSQAESDFPTSRPQSNGKPSKRVTFSAGASNEAKHEAEPIGEMGDVVIGRLHSRNSGTLAEQPMKLHVVERTPAAASANSSGAKIEIVEDSDDDSDFDGDEDDFYTILAQDHRANLDEDEELVEDDDEEGTESGEDFDTAMLQREAAEMYYSKREDLRASIGSFAGFGQIAVPGEGWDPEDVRQISENTVSMLIITKVETLSPSSGRRKTYIASRFKSARAARSFLATCVLPPGTTISDKDLVGVVRSGKLDNRGQLVVNEEDEVEDEADIGPKGYEMIEALRRGGETSTSTRVTVSGTEPTIPAVTSSNVKSVEASSTQPRTSKFMAARQTSEVPKTSSPLESPPESVQEEQVLSQTTRRTALSSTVFERQMKVNPVLLPEATGATGQSTASPVKASRFKARRSGQ
ncbi:hypothetical protein DACRYDRAFT_103850 [Dacryopinax primogenitus]|uniref:DUF3835 domain-containing protein n=1 Tax=Dacryopinax primogenitus (strain DJM 731) TaxID=1858805 RepID=M5G9A9_DACPD|nr:uncharacterized protein DACRYDRAFT_103850 [Dacryopinax primogenitus]EJU05364.1 hypothetical protein DACRYDRAFT_103850 [Dacryopinax primogenitus]